MMNGYEQRMVEELKNKGNKPVYIWEAEPHEEDPDHNHDFDTTLVILSGQITLMIDGFTKILQAGDVLHIPKRQRHSAVAGDLGCRYIVAERHEQ